MSQTEVRPTWRLSAMCRLGALALFGLLAACSPGQPELVELAALQRPASPNSYLVCPQSRTIATVDREPTSWPVSVDELAQVWLEALADEPRIALVADDPARHRYLFVQRTPILRFPDVIQLDVVAAPKDGATVCLYGRAVYGYSDFGKNRRRIEDWLARIRPPGA